MRLAASSARCSWPGAGPPKPRPRPTLRRRRFDDRSRCSRPARAQAPALRQTRSQHLVSRAWSRIRPRRPARQPGLPRSGRALDGRPDVAIRLQAERDVSRRHARHRSRSCAMSLERDLPGYMGPAFDDVAAFSVVADDELEFTLRRSARRFSLEALDLPIQQARRVADRNRAFPADGHSMQTTSRCSANEHYYAGKPAIDRIVAHELSVSPRRLGRHAARPGRHAVRGRRRRLDSLESSTSVKVFTFQRPYAYTVILNVSTPALRSSRRPARVERADRSRSARPRRAQRARSPSDGAGLAAALGATSPTLPGSSSIRAAARSAPASAVQLHLRRALARTTGAGAPAAASKRSASN